MEKFLDRRFSVLERIQPVSSLPSSLVILSCLPLPPSPDTLSFQKVTDQKIVEGNSPARRLIPAVAGPLLEVPALCLPLGDPSVGSQGGRWNVKAIAYAPGCWREAMRAQAAAAQDSSYHRTHERVDLGCQRNLTRPPLN